MFAKPERCEEIVGSRDAAAAVSAADVDSNRFTLKCSRINSPLCSEWVGLLKKKKLMSLDLLLQSWFIQDSTRACI